jgi:hypothetical protein
LLETIAIVLTGLAVLAIGNLALSVLAKKRDAVGTFTERE